MVELNNKKFKFLNSLAKEIYKTFNIKTLNEELTKLGFTKIQDIKYTKKDLSMILAEKMLLVNVKEGK